MTIESFTQEAIRRSMERGGIPNADINERAFRRVLLATLQALAELPMTEVLKVIEVGYQLNQSEKTFERRM